MRKIVTFLSLFFSISAIAQQFFQIGTTAVQLDTLASELNIPWEIQVDPGQQYLWVTERVGRINRIDLNSGAKVVVLDYIDSVEAYGEAGMLGMALHPDFENHPWIYVSYCYGPRDVNNNFFERISRFHYNGSVLENEEILLDGIAAYGNHNGSRLLFLQDGTLLVSTGDHNVANSAQDMNSLNGKFLRMTAAGAIPTDNPDPGSYIFTSGHRNPQGVLQLTSGKIVSSEHGPDTDDEINLIAAGRNYGWPLVHGFCDEPFEDTPCATLLYTEPIYNWTPTIAPNDLIYYDNTAFPEWNKKLLMTSLKDETLYAIQLDFLEENITQVDTYLSQQFGRLRDIAADSLKRIYIATNSGAAGTQAIIRLTPPNTLDLQTLKGSSVGIFPNPSSDWVTITGSVEQLLVFDNSGRQIKSFRCNGTQPFKFSVVDLDNGCYTVKCVETDGMVKIVRFQKN